MDRSEARASLEVASDRYRKRTKMLAAFWLLFFMLTGYLFLEYNVTWLAIVAFSISLAQLFIWIVQPDDSERVITLANEQHEKVVWVYSMEWSISPFGIYLFRRSYLKLHFEDGHVEDIRVPPIERYGLMKCLNILFPSASFGYTEERSQQYKSDPESLRQDFKE